MRRTLKWLAWLSVVFGLAVGVLVGVARAETTAEKDARLLAGLDHVMRAVFYGLDAQRFYVNGHEFSVKSTRFARAGSLVIVEGEIAHHRHGSPDARVYYTIKKSGATVFSADIRIDRGGLTSWSNRLARYLFGTPIGDDQLESLTRRLGRLVDSKWEATAELIVISIAIRADQFGRDRLAMYRARKSRESAHPTTVVRRAAPAVKVPRGDREPHDAG
jgi:hypothetical protein